jgi:hypothetical protein
MLELAISKDTVNALMYLFLATSALHLYTTSWILYPLNFVIDKLHLNMFRSDERKLQEFNLRATWLTPVYFLLRDVVVSYQYTVTTVYRVSDNFDHHMIFNHIIKFSQSKHYQPTLNSTLLN